ncbi:hypothetical protein Tco_0875256, partial [Tanacetum coccineum]
VKIDDPNITMEEYIRLEEEKARRRAIVFNDTLTSEATLSCEPTVGSLNNNEIDFRISFEESDDEDCTPTVGYFDVLDYFKDFEKEFPAIVYNDAQTSKLVFLTEPTVSIRRILRNGYGISTSCTVLGPREGKSMNVGGEFTNLEILKCWSLENFKPAVQHKFLLNKSTWRITTEQISGEFLILFLFNSRI